MSSWSLDLSRGIHIRIVDLVNIVVFDKLFACICTEPLVLFTWNVLTIGQRNNQIHGPGSPSVHQKGSGHQIVELAER